MYILSEDAKAGVKRAGSEETVSLLLASALHPGSGVPPMVHYGVDADLVFLDGID
jgi:hypothetical protein